MKVECVVCQEPIQTGEVRVAKSYEYGSVTLHKRCDHESPVPHFTESKDGESIDIETSELNVRGVIEGKGPIKQPMEGYCLRLHGERWDGLPTDQILLIHRKKRNGWGDVWLWCDNIQVDDDGDIMTNWQNYGKVKNMEVVA